MEHKELFDKFIKENEINVELSDYELIVMVWERVEYIYEKRTCENCKYSLDFCTENLECKKGVDELKFSERGIVSRGFCCNKWG